VHLAARGGDQTILVAGALWRSAAAVAVSADHPTVRAAARLARRTRA